MRRTAPPPASRHNSGSDPRNVRHSCGYAYNGYAWSSCPQCKADETGQYAMRCCSCRHPFFTAERVDLCPECDSGETTVIAAPDRPAVRWQPGGRSGPERGK